VALPYESDHVGRSRPYQPLRAQASRRPDPESVARPLPFPDCLAAPLAPPSFLLVRVRSIPERIRLQVLLHDRYIQPSFLNRRRPDHLVAPDRSHPDIVRPIVHTDPRLLLLL
jgi:hypothetical protein